MSTTTITTIETCTAEIHALLRDRAPAVASKSINPETLRGLCGTGAVLLIERLAQEGIKGELVAARSVFGNTFHYWVLADGVHADPTYLQFDGSVPYRVAQDAPKLVFGDWHDKPTTWAVEDKVSLSGDQAPERVLAAMGVSRA